MDILPPDIIHLIYKQKHQLEMLDLCHEIKNAYLYRVDTFRTNVDIWLNDFTSYVYYPECLIWNLTALRNIGELSNPDLLYHMDAIEETIAIHFGDVVNYDPDFCIIDKEFFYNNTDISIYD